MPKATIMNQRHASPTPLVIVAGIAAFLHRTTLQTLELRRKHRALAARGEVAQARGGREMKVLVRTLVAVLALGAVVAPSAAADIAVQVTQTNGLRIDVSGSESRLHVSRSGSPATLAVGEVDERPLTAGPGCQNSSVNVVRCSLPPLRFVTFTGSEFRDRLTLFNGVGDCLCDGRRGNDIITGADGADFILGDFGNDTLNGGAGGDLIKGGSGNDTITGGPGNDVAEGNDGDDVFLMGVLPDGADTLDGGAGTDTVSYGSRRARIEASIDGFANDGAPVIPFSSGERDNIAPTVENLTGGTAGDLLLGSSAPNRLVGGAGNDTLRGGSPVNQSGSEVGLLDDVLDGGLGSDILRGEGGRDFLLARDAVDDQVNDVLSCGTGPSSASSDRLDADVRDDDTRPLPTDCESISQGMVGEDPNVQIRTARRAAGRGLNVSLRCPRKTRSGCKGKLALESARRGFRNGVRYVIPRGKRGTVRLPGGGRPGAIVRVRSLERGQLGPRTTFQTLQVKR